MINESNSTPSVVRKGERLETDRGEAIGEILSIRRKRVFFRNLANRSVEYIEISEDPLLIFSEFATNIPGIASDGRGSFDIDRKTLREQTKNLAALIQQARAVPELDAKGRLAGFRLDMIMPGSVFESLGLKKGDLVTSVNGHRLESTSQAIALYQSLQNDASILLEVERNGQRETLKYSVR